MRTRGSGKQRYKDLRLAAYQETAREIAAQEIEMLDEKERRLLPIGTEDFCYIVIEIYLSRQVYKSARRMDIDNISKGLIDCFSGKGRSVPYSEIVGTIFLDDPFLILKCVIGYEMQSNRNETRILVWRKSRRRGE